MAQKLVAAYEPENLKELVESKIASAKAVQQGFPEILKFLNSSQSKENTDSEAEIKYYKGKNGVKKIYEEVLSAEEVRSFVNIEEIAQVFPENFPLFDNAFKKNSNMKMYEIVENSPEAKIRFSNSIKRERYYYKFLPKDMKLTAQDILVYENKVAIINFKEKSSGIVLRNEELYNNFKMLFDFIWSILPEEEDNKI